MLNMKKLTLTFTLLSAVSMTYSQNVGINTDGSAPGKMLDIKPTTGNDGIRINNTAGDATINLRGNGTDRWTFGFDDSDGDNFVISSGAALGTATDRFEIDENDDQIRSGFDGTAARPAWGFTSDENTGIYRSAVDELAFGAGGIEFLVFDEGGTDVGVFNEDANDIDFRFEGALSTELLYVDYGNEAIGISTQPDANNPIATASGVSSVRGALSIGNDGNIGEQFCIGLYLGNDPTILPETFDLAFGWGYIGWDAPGYDVWEVASNNFINTSRREAKRNIQTVQANTAAYLYNDLDNLKPSLYKYKKEFDTVEEGREHLYRPMAHLGLIVDEAPDYLKSATMGGIDIYSLSTYSVLMAKENKSRIDNLQEQIHGEGSIINGKAKITLPRTINSSYTVLITSHDLDARIAISSKDAREFTVVSNASTCKFDYVVYETKTSTNDLNDSLSEDEVDMLTISDEEKARIEKIKSMKLLSNKSK